MKLKVAITGPRLSGKTTLMNLFKKTLTAQGIEFETDICENINSENMTVTMSYNDIKENTK